MSFGKLKGDDDDKSTKSLEAVLRPTAFGSVSGGVESRSGVDAIIGRGSKIVGAVSFTGPSEIDGEVEGEIHSKERLTIGEAAQVKAKIVGGEIVVKGTVIGDIYASKSLILKKPARVVGNIQSAVLGIEEGVVFEGKCSMNARDNNTRQATIDKPAAA